MSTASAFEHRLRPLADPARAAPMRAYMKDQFAFLGLPAPLRRAAVKDLVAAHPQDPDRLLDSAEALWRLPEREFRYTAVDLLRHHHRRLAPAQLPRLQDWLLRDSWWDTVDGLAAVIGRIVLAARGAQVTMDAWIAHPDFWVRRAAMLHQLGWKGATDTERLGRHALLLAGEREFFIRKAIGWALRDYARTDPAFVRAFVDAHRARLSPLSLREAAKHC
ncbi:DNA alkylation repair protein [Massilia sp. ST3]|uniref:DNA alkylation repair protein n=1 Tax=Massilia sp. ST3 TaxID=2824903 RepID=UPI001B814AF3|nr:DNA alkylation repair protein [Massilia sp. ST3]MBQ5949316.1 DNA alkylation repair protein [Massilia sp. ST3]